MKKLVLAALVVLSIGHAARAALVIHVPDIVLSQSASVQTGSFDIFVEETDGTQATIQSFNVGLRQVPPLGTFTGIDATTSHVMILNALALEDHTDNIMGYVAGNDLYVTNDGASPVAVVNGSRDGLFRVDYSIPANAVGTTVLTLDPAQVRLFTGQTAVPYEIDNGSITVTPIPEPAAMGLALLALPLLARRRS
jgi:hypothetical protein